MKVFFVILLAAMTAWVAIRAAEIDHAHREAGRPSRLAESAGPAAKQLHSLVEQYGGQQVLLGVVGIVAGLILTFTVVMKLLKLLAFLCVLILAVVLWQAWERGYISTTPQVEEAVRAGRDYLRQP